VQRPSFHLRAGHLALAVAVPALWGPPPAVAGDPPFLLRLPDPAVSWVVYRSLRGAIDRLERSETCRAVLGDFTTPSGEPLSAVLEARGETPGRYLAGLLFLDGSSHPLCRGRRVAAFTSPGWRVVYVCSAVFRGQLERRSAEAEAVLIHEALHTLGLGENPPPPQAIQERVHARCVAGQRTIGPSLVAQGGDGIDAGGAARGQPGGGEGDGAQQGHDGDDREGVPRFDPEQKAPKNAAEGH
jgi:hypothetical protein